MQSQLAARSPSLSTLASPSSRTLALRTPANANLVAVAHAVLQRHGRSFALAGRLLPRDRRDDAAIVYAFCRLVDDTADDAETPELARAGLDVLGAWLRAPLGSPGPELSGRLRSAGLDAQARELVAAFVAVCERRSIDLGAAEELIQGARGDLGHVEVADDAELLRYGYRVAGTVGWMMCGVLGVTDRTALAQAIDLGIAMQITNICRDVREDAGMGRVYLPATRLRAAGIEPGRLLRGDVDRVALGTVVRDLLSLADRYYQSAAGAFAAIPMRARIAIVVASAVYRAIGVRLLRRHGGDPWHGRTVVPTATRWALAALAIVGALRYGRRSRRRHRASLHGALAGLPGIEHTP